VTPAVLTVTADSYLQPAIKHPLVTPAMLTATAHSYTQPDPPGPVTKTDGARLGFDSFEPANNNPQA